jgi:hypothetical protein
MTKEEIAKLVADAVSEAVTPLYQQIADLRGTKPPVKPGQEQEPDGDHGKTIEYERMIADLDREHAEELEAQTKPTGNNLEIHQEVARRMAAQRAYEVKREKLDQLRIDSLEVSQSVQHFLEPGYTPSKFDVLSGKETLDDSMHPQGKSLGKNI